MKYLKSIAYTFAFISLTMIWSSCTKSSGPTALVPVITTIKPYSITPTSAISGGYIVSNGGATIYRSGVCFSKKPGPTTAASFREINVSTGLFHTLIANLGTDSTYYVRAYAVNYAGTGYGEEYSFKTVASSYTIGQSYGGGLIVYIDSTGQHGLVAAASDISGTAQWGCSTDTTHSLVSDANATAIGTGMANTTAIISACSEVNAARLCDEYTIGGFSDWYLPSKDELNLLYVTLASRGLGNFTKFYYWSSSQGSLYSSWMYNFLDGTAVNLNKEDKHNIRAVRSF